MRGSAVLAALVLGGAALSGCAVWNEPSASRQVFVMDTIMTLELYGEQAEDALNGAVERLYQWQGLWAATQETSEVWAINHGEGNWVPISPETQALLTDGLELCARTDGVLDLTAYPAVMAWGFTTGEHRVVPPEERAELAERIDYTQVELDPQAHAVRLPSDMALDFGGVAKGYVGQMLRQQLRDAGVSSALLNLGGNVQSVGGKPSGEPWEIGIQDPTAQQPTPLAVLQITDQAVVTSGDYQRYFDQEGQRYCHIMDPDTAAPAQSGVKSVTVVGSDGLVCDALSTALFVMGLEEGTAFWRANPQLDVELLWVTEDGTLSITQGLEDSFRLAQGQEQRKVVVIEP